MPLANYGVLRGVATGFGREDGGASSPHFHIVLEAGGVRWRVPVNVRSSKNQSNDPNRPDQSLVVFRLEDPITDTTLPARLEALAEGFHDAAAGAPALDYLREPVFDRAAMQILRFTGPEVSDDVQDILEVQVRRAMAGGAAVFAFGGSFDSSVNPHPADRQFQTTRGVHDIHMNQGNPPGGFFAQNGVFQDGGLVIRQSAGRWVGFFTAFQTQLLPTGDEGNPLPGAKPIKPVGTGITTVIPNRVEGPVQILAAMVNPPGADPGRETVTLMNVSPAAVNLNGWSVIDKNGRREPLFGSLQAGDAQRIRLTGVGTQLSNDGGTIRLEDAEGRLMDTVSYSKAAASVEGISLTF